MPHGDAVQPPPAPTPIPAPRFLLRQRDPPTFTGNDATDVEDWLRLVDRAANHNNWDPAMRLANVVFYLSGTALAWFENNEAGFDSWDTFKSLVVAAFGQREERKQRALRYLQTRHQAYDEPFSSYMADVLNACRRTNPEMTEPDKISHLLKGLSQHLFNAVALMTFSTVSELSDACKRYDELQRQRILPATDLESSVSRAPPLFHTDHTELRSLIRSMIREELALMTAERSLPSLDDRISSGILPPEDSLRKLVQAELNDVVSPARAGSEALPQRTYAEVCKAASHVVQTPMVAPVLQNPPPLQPFRPAYRPPVICFYCNMPGHIARRCFRRQSDMMQASSWRPFRREPAPPSYRNAFEPEQARLNDCMRNGTGSDYWSESRKSREGQRRWGASPSRPFRSPSPRAGRRRSVSPLQQSMPNCAPSN